MSEMAHFWSNLFLGDLVLMPRLPMGNQQLHSLQYCLSLVRCSHWAVLRWDKGCCRAAVECHHVPFMRLGQTPKHQGWDILPSGLCLLETRW